MNIIGLCIQGYIFYVRKLYNVIGWQVAGLLFKDGGPIIGVQLENEFMSASAPWETTPPQVHEWTNPGNGGEAHMRILKEIARAAGLSVPLYTCTGWGGSPVLEDEILPLYGDYAYWPWIFYGDIKEHPATQAYLFRDYHSDTSKCPDFNPPYNRTRYPYACCEIGGGMQVWYNYRFTVPPESVEAMTIMKVAGGCNFLGYYMYHGGSNPIGRHSYMNERSCPKISYDFQAPLGEFGQERESYHRLRLLHYFLEDRKQSLCRMKTVLQENADLLTPQDTETVRFAARASGSSGFLFLNNFQDHLTMKDHDHFCINLEFENERMTIPEKDGLMLQKDVCCVLPFNLPMDGVMLKYATAQFITSICHKGENYYFFFVPDGMKGEYCFDQEAISQIDEEKCKIERLVDKVILHVEGDITKPVKMRTKGDMVFNLVTLSRAESLKFWKVKFLGITRVILADAGLLAMKEELELECNKAGNVSIEIFPEVAANLVFEGAELLSKSKNGLFTEYVLFIPYKNIEPEIEYINDAKAVIRFSDDDFTGLKELILSVDYTGDVGYAYINGKLVDDNFSNGTSWEIGLKKHANFLMDKELYIYISPIKTGNSIKSDSAMAARVEIAGQEFAKIHSIRANPLYAVSVAL